MAETILAEDTSDKYFSEAALKEAKAESKSPKSRLTLIRMKPSDFLKVAKQGMDSGKTATVKRLTDNQTKFDSIPYLAFENNGDGTARVSGHEGRHRSRYLVEQGNKPMLVRFSSSEAGEGKAIRWGSQEGYDKIDNWPKVLYAEESSFKMDFPDSIIYPRKEKTEAAKKPLFNFDKVRKPIGRKAEVIKAPPVKSTVKPKTVTSITPPKDRPKPVKPPAEKKDPNTLKSWKGGNKKEFYEIELVREGKGHAINTYVSNDINPAARSKSSSYMPKLTDAEAVKKYDDFVKLVTTAKGLTIKKSIVKVKADFVTKGGLLQSYLEKCQTDALNETDPVALAKLNVEIDSVKQKIAEQEANQMDVEAKLAVFAKKKVVKKKRNQKQILTHLKNGGKKLLKMEERLKAKKAALDKELEKLKGIKIKHKARMIDHIQKMKDRAAKKAGAINPPTKFPKQDLAKAIIKKDKKK